MTTLGCLEIANTLALILALAVPLGRYIAAADDGGDVDELLVTGRRLATGQQQQAGDQLLAAINGLEDGLGHCPQLARRGAGIGEGDVDLGSHDRQRRAQLV